MLRCFPGARLRGVSFKCDLGHILCLHCKHTTFGGFPNIAQTMMTHSCDRWGVRATHGEKLLHCLALALPRPLWPRVLHVLDLF